MRSFTCNKGDKFIKNKINWAKNMYTYPKIYKEVHGYNLKHTNSIVGINVYKHSTDIAVNN